MEDSSFLGENLCFLQWDKSNRAMTNAGELKFFSNYRTVRKKKGEKGSFLDLLGVASLPTCEELKNLEISLFLLFFLILAVVSNVAGLSHLFPIFLKKNEINAVVVKKPVCIDLPIIVMSRFTRTIRVPFLEIFIKIQY